jgi:hypothetical protein
MGCEGGEVEEEEVEVVDRASNNSRGCKGKVFPGIRDSGALCEEVEGGFRGRSAFCTGWRGCEAETVAASLKREDVMKGSKPGVD